MSDYTAPYDFTVPSLLRRKIKRKEKKMPYVENIVVKVNSLIFKPIYIPCYSIQGMVSFLYRGFGQGGCKTAYIIFYYGA
jgi:hypothetical protein